MIMNLKYGIVCFSLCFEVSQISHFGLTLYLGAVGLRAVDRKGVKYCVACNTSY